MTVFEDYGTTLPEDEIKRREAYSDSDDNYSPKNSDTKYGQLASLK
jgi:hypothetical protein